jgi:hypothetical protein
MVPIFLIPFLFSLLGNRFCFCMEVNFLTTRHQLSQVVTQQQLNNVNFLDRASGYDPVNNQAYFSYQYGLMRVLPTSSRLINQPQMNMDTLTQNTFINVQVPSKGLGLDVVSRVGYICAFNRKIFSFNMNDAKPVGTERYASPSTMGGEFSVCVFDIERQAVYMAKTEVLSPIR